MSSSGGNMSSGGSSSAGSGAGSGAKTHSEVSRNGPSGGSTSLSSDNSHFVNKTSADSNPSANSTTLSQQRMAVTSNSQDCSAQYIQTKEAALPPR